MPERPGYLFNLFVRYAAIFKVDFPFTHRGPHFGFASVATLDVEIGIQR
jgi:hypothetical protein